MKLLPEKVTYAFKDLWETVHSDSNNEISKENLYHWNITIAVNKAI